MQMMEFAKSQQRNKNQYILGVIDKERVFKRGTYIEPNSFQEERKTILFASFVKNS